MHPTRLRCENATYPQYAFHFHALSAGRLSCQFCELIFARTLKGIHEQFYGCFQEE
jgi:hypothetical protein